MVLDSTTGPRFFASWNAFNLPSSLSDVQSFTVREQPMLVATSYASGMVYIYNALMFSSIQNISITNAVATKDLVLDGETYLVVAVVGSPYISRIYRWMDSEFVATGIINIDPISVISVDTFSSIEHGAMLALKIESFSTRIYRMSPTSGPFVQVQLLQKLVDTTETNSVHFFAIENKPWLSLTRDRVCSNCSHVFEWVNNSFIPFQSFPLARDLYPVTYGCDVFLVAAGIQEGEHIAKSVIYRYDRSKRSFDKYQVLDEPNACTVKQVVIRLEHFLLLALSGYTDGHATGRLYRMSGSSFSLYQQLDFVSDAKLLAFFKSGDKYILAAAGGDRELELHKWNSLTDSCIV